MQYIPGVFLKDMVLNVNINTLVYMKTKEKSFV